MGVKIFSRPNKSVKLTFWVFEPCRQKAMSQKKKTQFVRPPKLIIVASVDILLTVSLFYNFSQWGSYQTTPAKLLGVFACIYMVNDWMTTRSSFDVYSPRIFFTDVIVIFLFSNFPNALHDTASQWGYSPFFWLSVGLVEFLYVFWDMIVRSVSPSEKAQKTMTIWVYLSFLSTAMAVGVFFYQIFGESLLLGHIFSAVVVIYILLMTAKWNWERYQRAKAEGTSFLA